jgi:DNA/RNA-binding domain of Phe-tRNA-synthetase-like protein
MHEPGVRCSWVEPAAAAIGVKFAVAVIHGVRPARKSKELEAAKRQAEERARAAGQRANEILLAYRRMLDSVGATTELASPQLLLQFVLEK